MSTAVFVDVQEGTTRLRIHEYLAAWRDIEVLPIASERREDAAEVCMQPPNRLAAPACRRVSGSGMKFLF